MELLLTILPALKWAAGFASLAVVIYLLLVNNISEGKRYALRAAAYLALALFCLIASYQRDWFIWPLMCSICFFALVVVVLLQSYLAGRANRQSR